MSDFSQITIVGRIGKDAEVRTTQGGKEVATFSVATDTGCKDKESGQWTKNVNWHNVVCFQPGLVNILKTRAKKGARVFIQGEIAYRTWRKDGEETDRTQPEIKIGPSATINFLDAVEKGDKDAHQE